MERVYTTPLLDKLGVRPGHAGRDRRDRRRGRATIPRACSPSGRRRDGRARRCPTPTSSSWPPTRQAELAALATLRRADPSERRDLGRLAQGQGRHAPRRRGHGRGREPTTSSTTRSSPSRRRHTALRLVIPVALRPRALRASTIRAWTTPRRPHRDPGHRDHGRGPKTLPLIGNVLGRGVKEARKEAAEFQKERDATTAISRPPRRRRPHLLRPRPPDVRRPSAVRGRRVHRRPMTLDELLSRPGPGPHRIA